MTGAVVIIGEVLGVSKGFQGIQEKDIVVEELELGIIGLHVSGPGFVV